MTPKIKPCYLQWAVYVFSAIVLYVYILEEEGLFLEKVAQMNLFLPTPLFFKQQMVVSGGILTWAGTFFTQFFYYPWVGVLMLFSWWAFLIWLTRRAFSISDEWWAVSLIPVALLLITEMDTGYWLFYLKLRGHFFVATIGLCAAIALVWAYRSLPRLLWLRIAFIIVCTVIIYPLLGFYGLLATLLMGLTAVSGRQWLILLCAIAALLVIPLLYYRYVFYQTNIVNIYWTALPVYRIDKTYYLYYIPYYLIAAYFSALALIGKKLKTRGSRPIFQAAVFILIVAAVCIGWYRDGNFHKEIAMEKCVAQGDWEGVLTIASDETDDPTRCMVMLKNLALFRLGRQGDEMYHYLNGDKEPNAPFMVHMSQTAGKMLYLHYGKINYCYRWCMEDGVEFGWRAEYLMYMTCCAIINEEIALARKYIDILKRTLFYKKWAQDHEKFLAHPSLLKSDPYYKPIIHMMGYKDVLDSDNSLVEMYLLNLLARTPSNDPILQEAALLAALQMKDISMFWPQFNQYAILHLGERMPIHYQEAAYLYGHLENKVDISKMPFDDSVVKSYEQFMELARQCRGMTEEQMKPLFFPRFGNTFYYDYFLIRGQKSY